MDLLLLRVHNDSMQTAVQDMISDYGGDTWLQTIEDMTKCLGEENTNHFDSESKQKLSLHSITH